MRGGLVLYGVREKAGIGFEACRQASENSDHQRRRCGSGDDPAVLEIDSPLPERVPCDLERQPTRQRAGKGSH